jgi:hypothetical protein
MVIDGGTEKRPAIVQKPPKGRVSRKLREIKFTP